MPLALIAPLVFAAGSYLPAEPRVEPIDSRWEVVARDSNGDCDLVVTGDGKFFLISATGLGAYAPARYMLSNGDMKPIDWRVKSDGSGRFARYYLPFRWHRRGGEVSVTVASDNCTVSSTFAWRRATADAR